MTDVRELTQIVRLVKKGGPGHFPAGVTYEIKHRPDLPAAQAVQRTFALLKRDYPDENPMDWTVEESDASQ